MEREQKKGIRQVIRSTLIKVMWVGRATVFLVGLAVILALVFGVASTALGKNGQAIILGKANNTATKVTGLIGKVATGSALVVKNPKGGSALGLQVNAGQAPLRVNADAGKATNLDADKLDGKNSTGFYAAGSKVDDSTHADQADNATKADNADTVDGKHAADFAAATHAHDDRYFTETESDGRYLFKGQKAADSDRLDGYNSTGFLKVDAGGLARDAARTISPGESDPLRTLVLSHGPESPHVRVDYDCPTDLATNGTLRIKNLKSETINLFSDNGGENPNGYKQLTQNQTFQQAAAFGGEHITFQVQGGTGVGTIEVFSVHRTSSLSTGTDNKCHVQVQGLFTH